ncbi:MAG: hypothetical protein KAH11_09840 [Rhodospirillales bacterium]|nr:hypothetical protein [Rhodospirillales bacterium]
MSEEQTESAGGAGSVVNPDGTTNWTVVFEDPDQGILPAVQAVTTEQQLRAVMAQIAHLLFKRKRDEGPRAEFQAKVYAIIDDVETDGFEAVRARVLEMLDKEKNHRIQKAILHIKAKNAGQSVERRRDSKDESALSLVLDNPLFLGGGIAAVLAAITVVLLLVVLPASVGPDREEESPKPAPAAHEQMKAAEPAPAPAAEAPPPPDAKKIEMIALKPVLTEALIDGKARRVSLIPLVRLGEDGNDITLFCALSPRIVEGVLLLMQAATRDGKPFSAGLLKKVAEQVASDINSRSRRVHIDRLVLRDLRDAHVDVAKASNRGCERVDVDLSS